MLDEMVLHREVGGTCVMRAQLEHLVKCVSSQLSVQVVPAAVNPHRSGAFTIATVDGADVGYAETPLRGIVTSNRQDVARLSGIWESIRTFTLSQQESAQFIERLVAERWN